MIKDMIDVPFNEDFIFPKDMKIKNIFEDNQKYYYASYYLFQEKLISYREKGFRGAWHYVFLLYDAHFYEIKEIQYAFYLNDMETILQETNLKTVIYHAMGYFLIEYKSPKQLENVRLIINKIFYEGDVKVEDSSIGRLAQIEDIDFIKRVKEFRKNVFIDAEDSFSSESKYGTICGPIDSIWSVYPEYQKIHKEIMDHFNHKTAEILQMTDDPFVIFPLDGVFDEIGMGTFWLLKDYNIIGYEISASGCLCYLIEIPASDADILELANYSYTSREEEHEQYDSPYNRNRLRHLKINAIIKPNYSNKTFLLQSEFRNLPFVEKSRIFRDALWNVGDIYCERKIKEEVQEAYQMGITKWAKEKMLFSMFKILYPDAIYQYRADWLGAQTLDIYIPQLDLGIEYQGEQHYSKVAFFGSSEARDREKRKKCLEHGTKLLEWSYKEWFSLETIRAHLIDLEILGEDVETWDLEKIIKNAPGMQVFDLLKEFMREDYKPRRKVRAEKIEKIPSELICKYSLEGQFIKSYTSIGNAAKDNGVSSTGISNALNGKQFKSAGFLWRRMPYKHVEPTIDTVQKISTCLSDDTLKKNADSEIVRPNAPKIQEFCDGVILTEYSSMEEAAKCLHISIEELRHVISQDPSSWKLIY